MSAAGIDLLLPEAMVYFCLDTDTGAFEMNHDWLDRFGYAEVQLTLALWYEMMPLDDRNRVQLELRELGPETGEPHLLRYRIADARGVAYDVETRIAPASKTVFHGIHRILEPGTTDAARPSDHDLANHLAGILGFGELLRGCVTSSGKAHLDELIGATRRAIHQVSDDRDAFGGIVHRLANELDLEAHPFAQDAELKLDLATLTAIVRPIVERQRRSAGRDAILSLRAEGPSSINPTCSLCGLRPSNHVSLCISDNGRQIPRAEMQDFFSPGFDLTRIKRPDPEESDEVVDAVDLLHQQQGHVTLASTPAGSQVTFFLPSFESTVPSRQHHTGTILVTDDDPAVARYLKTILDDSGFTTVLAEDGETALALFSADIRRFDLVISDLTLPGVQGDEVLASMHSLAPATPLILLSGSRERASNPAGIVQLTKPISSEQLVSIVTQLLEDRDP